MAAADSRDIATWADSELLIEDAIAPLEAFEATQSSTTALYNARLSRALLRLYSMYPLKANKDVALRILAKSITALPDLDFQAAFCIVPASATAAAPVKDFAAMEKALQHGSFEAFWTISKDAAVRAVLDGVAGFDDVMREVITRLLNRVYQKVEVAKLNAWLNTADAAAVVTKYGWTVDAATGVATAPALADNTPRPKRAVDDRLKYSDVAGLIALTR